MRKINIEDVCPVVIKYSGNDRIRFSGRGELTYNNDGYPLYITDTLKSLIDVSNNNNTFMGLLPESTPDDILEDSVIIINTTGPLLLGVYVDAPDIQEVYTVDISYNLNLVEVDGDDAILFTFDHVYSQENQSGTITRYYKLRYRDQVLTIGDNHTGTLEADINTDNQIFKILQTTTNTYNFMFKGNYGTLRMPTATSSTDYTTKMVLLSPDLEYVNDFESETTDFTGYGTTNQWIRYNNFYSPEYTSSRNILSVDVDNTIPNIGTGVLLTAPYNNITFKDKIAYLPMDLVPTKNFKTIGGNLTLKPNSIGEDAVAFRDYHRIFTGGNQTNGYSNINLGYSSEYSKIIKLAADEYTFFHIPPNYPSTTLSRSGLDIAGGYGGLSPKYSDRIYKKLSNYSDTTWWGGGSNNDSQDGTWLCAWLSGGSTDEVVWMERYYDKGVISPENALNLSDVPLVSDSKFISKEVPVVDIPATMTIEANAYYKYYHIGRRGFSEIASNVQQVSDSKLVLGFAEFDNVEIIRDNSGYVNNGYIQNSDGVNIVDMDFTYGNSKDSAILLNGSGEVYINTSPELNIPMNKSINIWTYSTDFDTNTSSTIYSYFFRGGDKLEYINHGLYYSYIIPSQVDNNTIIKIANAELSGQDSFIDITQIPGECVSVAVDMDGYHWIGVYNEVTDESKIFKLSQSGGVMESTKLADSSIIKQLLIIDDNYGLIVYSKNAVTYKHKFSLLTLQLIGNGISETTSGIAVNTLNALGNLSYTWKTDIFDIDIMSIGTDINNSTTIHYCYIDANKTDISIDGLMVEYNPDEEYESICSDGNAYTYLTSKNIISGSEYIRLYRIDESFTSNYQSITLKGIEYNEDALNKVFIAKEQINGKSEDVIYWIGYKSINKYLINRRNEIELYQNICVDDVFTGSIYGDYSGYVLNKLAHIQHNKSSYLKYSIFKQIDQTQFKYTIKGNPPAFSTNWNMLTIIDDTDAKNLSMHINGEKLVDTTYSNGTTNTFYSTGSIMTIGSGSAGEQSVTASLGLSGRALDGGIAGFSIYARVLNANDLMNLYRSKFEGSSDMVWVVDNGIKYFIEDIKYLFKFKKPGIKSQFFNIIIRNLDIPEDKRTEYEDIIRSNVTAITPVNTKLVNIIWR